MAYDKVIDSELLEADLAMIADAIREKGGASEALIFPEGFVSAVEAISSGVELNFQVVPNPQPSSPKENTIWVDTDNINKYYFSATQPENMVNGDVWFPTGSVSEVEFNALKNGGIQVYPISAKQYVNGTWVEVVAKIYQGGQWVNWIRYLFKSGEGKKIEFSFSAESANVSWTVSNDVISVTQKSTTKAMSRVFTEDPVDLTFYSKIYMELVCTLGVATYKGTFAVSKEKPAWQSDSVTWTAIQTLPETSNIQIAELDVSALTGAYYIAFGGSVKCEIYNLWME